MTRVVSKVCSIQKSDELLYNFTSDFNNLKKLIPPDKVSELEVTNDTCKFNAEGIGKVGIKIIEKKEFKLIKISGEGKSSFDFVIWIQYVKVAENDTKMRLTLEAKLNPMMKAMLKKQLQKGIDTIADQLALFYNTKL